jgi:hypothetical protein
MNQSVAKVIRSIITAWKRVWRNVNSPQCRGCWAVLWKHGYPQGTASLASVNVNEFGSVHWVFQFDFVNRVIRPIVIVVHV